MQAVDVRELWNVPAGYDTPLGDPAFLRGDFAAVVTNARVFIKAVNAGNVSVLDDLGELVARFRFIEDAATGLDGFEDVAANAASWAVGVADFVAKVRREGVTA